MRKVLISLAAAVATLAVAAPASAQFYPAPARSAYGYNTYGQARSLQVRLDRIQRDINHLAQYRMITRNEHHKLMRDSREIERSLHRNARDGWGLDPRETYNTERKIVRLEQKIARDVRDGRQWRYRW